MIASSSVDSKSTSQSNTPKRSSTAGGPHTDQDSALANDFGSRPPQPQRMAASKQSLTQGFTSVVWRSIKALVSSCGWILIAPLRAYLSLRRSVTVASIVALLALFMTLNVIWGFPWSGIMGGCVAMLIGGWGMNRIFGPKLQIGMSLPRSAIAGQPFSLSVRLANPRYFPAMDLRLGWHREGVRDVYRAGNPKHWDASPPVSVSFMRSGGDVHWQGAMRFDTRGIHPLPPFQVASTFPFHLFHSRTDLSPDAQIAITPAPLTGEDDPTARVMLAAIGDWAQQLVAGAPVEYVGNREYQVGMSVRKWDFASWARVGRPIVREYQSPSVQSVTLIVDTSQPNDSSDASKSNSPSAKDSKEADIRREQQFERLMSAAASAVADISARRVQLRMYLTNEHSSEFSPRGSAAQNAEGHEPLLVRLAAAERVDDDLALKRMHEVIEICRGQPTLLLSLFDLDSPLRKDLASRLPANVTYVPISSAAVEGE